MVTAWQRLKKVDQTNRCAAVEAAGTEKGPTGATGSGDPAKHSVEASRCMHCGETCRGTSVIDQGRSFCCVGCQTVFTLLTDGGLGQFYQLASTPGTQMSKSTAQKQWAFLDDLSIQERLLDFADERQAKVTLYLPTIHCIACVWLLENLFRLQTGIGESRVNFSRRETSITFDRTKVELSEVAALLT